MFNCSSSHRSKQSHTPKAPYFYPNVNHQCGRHHATKPTEADAFVPQKTPAHFTNPLYPPGIWSNPSLAPWPVPFLSFCTYFSHHIYTLLASNPPKEGQKAGLTLAGITGLRCPTTVRCCSAGQGGLCPETLTPKHPVPPQGYAPGFLCSLMLRQLC